MDHIESVLSLVIESMNSIESGEIMADNEKFETFKKQQVKENDTLYGKEMEEQYDAPFIQQVKKRNT